MSSPGRRCPRMRIGTTGTAVGSGGRRSKRQKDNNNGTSAGKSSDSAGADTVKEEIRDDNVLSIPAPVPLLNGTEIGKELICACCMDIVILATSVVPCGHTFCNPCLFQSIEKCPTCRHNVLATIPNRTVNNTIQELIRLQQQEIQQQQEKQSSSAPTTTTQTRRGTTANATTTSEPTTITSTTSFFSLDDIQSYHDRVRDAPPERTLEVSCRRSSSSQNRYRPAMMSTATNIQAQHNFRRRNGVWELVANSDDDDDDDEEDDDDDDDDDDEENTVFDDFVDNDEIQWLRQQDGDGDAVDPFAIDFGLFGNPNAAARAGNNRNPYFFELLLGNSAQGRAGAAATTGNRGPRTQQQEQLGLIANRRRDETRQRRQSALQQLAASRRRVQQRNNNGQQHRDIIDETTRRVLAGMNLTLDPPRQAQTTNTTNRTNNAGAGTAARNNRAALRQRQQRERVQPSRAAPTRNNNTVNNDVQVVNPQPEVRRIVRAARPTQSPRGRQSVEVVVPNVARARQAVEVVVPNAARISQRRRRPRSPSPVVVGATGRRVLRSNSASSGPSRIRARITGRSTGSPIEIE